MGYKKWVIRDADKERASEISEQFNIDPFIAFLLVSRGITDDYTVSAMLTDSYVAVSPFDFYEMDEAVFAVGEAMDNGERICIYGDYDCDGVTSTAMLVMFLRNLGADIMYYIPDRESEGYGLNTEAIDKIRDAGANLIVTVDNGISAVEEAEYIYQQGMRLVVTDHHQLGDALPRAEAVVNPYRAENELEFRDYCGVGVAFKLISAMYDGDVSDLLQEYSDLVAIGTIADVVPLLGENRAFVKAGLQKINDFPREAIQAFIQSNGKREYNSNDIAFQLCPRINAMGRMDDASKAVEFLLSTDSEHCAMRCEQLNVENAHRQEVERSILDDIQLKINTNPRLVSGRVIVIAGKGYHHGVVGIVAANLLEKYAKPAIVIGIDENGVARGSARSMEGFNIFDSINACADDLVRFGGHPMAAGITLDEDKIDAFREHINAYALEQYAMLPPSKLVVDCKISPDYLSLDLADNLSVLEPYGAMNPQAVFGVYNMRLLSVSPLSEGKHIRLELERKGCRIRVVKFGTPYDEFPYTAGDVLDIAVRISKNFYREKYYLSIQAVDIKLHSADDERYFKEKNDYELFRLTGKVSGQLYPSRDICACVYKYLKAHGGYRYSREDLYFRLQDKMSYAQLMFALLAFSQAGLIELGDTIALLPVKDKVNLEDTKILKSVRERTNLG